MGKHIFLARDFFDEDDMRDLLASPSLSNPQRLRVIGIERGMFLSKDSSVNSLINDVAMIPFDWKRLNSLSKYLDSDDAPGRARVARLNNVVGLEALDDVMSDFKERAKEKISASSHIKDSETHARISNKYIKRNPSLLKGLQRVEVSTEIEVTPLDGGIEIKFSSDERSEELAALFLASVRKVTNRPEDQITQDEVNLTGLTPEEKSSFFTKLIVDMPQFRFSTVTGVRLHRAGEEDTGDEGEKNSKAAQEKVVAGRIESASLHGDNLLLTALYKELADTGYFIGSLTWEGIERVDRKRKVILEVGFNDPQQGKGFFINLKGIYENDSDGESRLIPRDARKFERLKMVKIVSDEAFKLARQLAGESDGSK